MPNFYPQCLEHSVHEPIGYSAVARGWLIPTESIIIFILLLGKFSAVDAVREHLFEA